MWLGVFTVVEFVEVKKMFRTSSVAVVQRPRDERRAKVEWCVLRPWVALMIDIVQADFLEKLELGPSAVKSIASCVVWNIYDP